MHWRAVQYRASTRAALALARDELVEVISRHMEANLAVGSAVVSFVSFLPYT
jgi:hypothetical protein